MGYMQIFSIFSKVIKDLPVPAILPTLSAECKMLQDDIEHYRSNLTEDVLSILCFGGFVKMLKADNVMRCSLQVPTDHVEFYKETIARLVQAGELSPSAMDQFEYAFMIRN
jgi:hypothetical protein